MAGYIGSKAVSVNTTSATISDDLAVGDDLTVTDDATVGGTLGVTGVLTTTAATVFNGGFASNGDSTITINDNGTALTLVSTDTDAGLGPQLDLFRNPGQAGTDGDLIGQINFFGLNDASEQTHYLYLNAKMNDVANGSEDVRWALNGIMAGEDVSFIEFTAGTTATGADPELVFNNVGKDVDFRVETDAKPYCLFVNSTQNNVSIGYSAESLSQTPGLVILSKDTSGGVYLIKEDGSQPSSGEGLGSFGWRGLDDTNSMNAADARITAFAAENHDGSNAATNMRFYVKTTSQGPGNGPVEGLRITEALNIDIQGNLVIGTAGKGIDFSVTGDGAGTDTSELLDDYEEGTFTPAFIAITNPTYAVQLGYYTKVGRKVSFLINVQWSAGTSIGQNISGLPYAVGDVSEYFFMSSTYNNHGVVYPTGRTTFVGYPEKAQSYVQVACTGSGVAPIAPTFGTAGAIYISGFYFIN